jgi:hypothetical protein
MKTVPAANGAGNKRVFSLLSTVMLYFILYYRLKTLELFMLTF